MARPKRGPSGRRVGWAKLAPSTRKRYEGAGITKSQWEAGVDLRGARGHAPAPRASAAPSDLTTRVVGGTGSPADIGALQTWARSRLAPSWTRGLDADVAAALSQIPWPPSQWRDVILTPAADEAPWTMRVVPKGRPQVGLVEDRAGKSHPVTAYDAVIEIPGGGAPGTGARQVLDLLAFGPAGTREDNQRWQPMNFDLTGTV